MKDIRNFFGGGAPVKKTDTAEKEKAKIFSKKTEDDEDFLIESSDDEWKSDAKPERKRLKGKNIAVKSPDARMTTSESLESPKKQLSSSIGKQQSPIATVIDLNDEPMTVDLSSPVKSSVADIVSPKIVLPVLKTSVKPVSEVSSDKKRKEIDPNSYFGLPPSTPPKPVKKVKQEVDLKSPISAKKKVVDSGLQVEEFKFVITGVLTSGSREDVETMILSAGGKIAKAVSGKTDFLVVGELLEDGRPVSEGTKYKTAVEKGVKIINEEILLNMIASDSSIKNSKNVDMKKESSSFSSTFNSTKQTTSSSSSSSSSNHVGIKHEVEQDMLWVDKHKPKNSSELIGSAELVRKMSEWLKRWEETHIKKTYKVPFSKENPGARAVLLSGPPGIGKTTVATLISKEFGYDVLEMNASDTRNKKEIGDQLTDAVMSKAISVMNLGSSAGLKKRLIIMDEVDGMGGSDRGGVAELIKIIKMTKTPIVCICNDRQSTKIKSLVNHCFDLRVKRPTKQQIATRLVAIAAKEGLQMDQNAGEILVEQVGNDIRQALNTMQMWKASSSHMQFAEVKNGMHRIEKDKVLRQTPFDACLQILGGAKSGSLDDRYNSFFIDYSLLPLMVQQNYIDSARNGVFKQATLDEAARMDELSRASDAVSDVDMIGARIMGQDQHWELLPAQAAFCCKVGSVIQGFQPFPSFPAWLGKNSSQNKMSRLTKEIVHHSSLSIGQGFGPIRLDYIPYVRDALLSLLLKDDPENINQVIDLLDSYGLSKDDMMETLKEMQFIIEGDKLFKDRYDVIETKVKTALTKTYNNASHRSQLLVSEISTKGRKSRGGGGGSRAVAYDEDGNIIEDESNMGEDEEAEDDGNDDDNIEAFIAKSKKAKAADKAVKAATKKATGKK